MKLIVGLGNPGKEYIKTRHNLGFYILDTFCKDLKFKNKFNGQYVLTKINNEDVIFLKPQSFMNLSGIVVKKYVKFFKIDINDILIIYDDMDFELGTYKLKPSGSAGGHNGIKNIIENLKTENIKRLRVGISKIKYNKVDYVIKNFTKKEFDIINKLMDDINDILKDYFIYSFDILMNKYNKHEK